MKVHSWARTLRETDARYILIRGGRWSTKSHEVAQWILERMRTEAGDGVFLFTREKQVSIKDSNFAMVKRMIRRLDWDKYFNITSNEITSLETGLVAQFQGLSANLQNIRSRPDLKLLWVEEAQFPSQDAWDTIGPTARPEVGEDVEDEFTVPIVATWNPTYPEDPISKLDATEGINAERIWTHWSMLAYPSAALHDERRKTLRVTPDLYGHIWDGEFRPYSASNPFGAVNINRCYALPPLPDSEFTVAGIDLAFSENSDSDWTYGVKLSEWGEELSTIRFRSQHHSRQVARLAEWLEEEPKVEYAIVDSAGSGRVVVDDLRAKDIQAVGVNFTRPVKIEWVRYLSKRMDEGRLRLRDQVLRAELLAFGEDDKTGRMEATYGHDDGVCALMLGTEAIRRCVGA